MIFNNLRQRSLGLDISDFSLKLIQLQKKDHHINLKSWGKINIPEGYFHKGEIQEPEKTAALIKNLILKVKGEKIKSDEVIACLPETKTFIKLLSLPWTKEENLENVIREEAIRHIPEDIDNLYADWQITSSKKDYPSNQRKKFYEENKKNRKIDILFGAAPKKIIESYVQTIKIAGLIPVAMEIEAVSICRALLPSEENQKKGRMIIDFGATRTSLIICHKDIIQFTISLPISGIEITQAIADSLKITEKQAEEAKLICGLDQKKCKGALKEILYKTINKLIKKIKEVSLYYQNNFPENGPLEEILLSGGGANFLNIENVLQESLSLPVKKANPWGSLSIKPKMLFHESISYATAMGLALRPIQDKYLYF